MKELISAIAGILSVIGGFVCIWLSWPTFLILAGAKILTWIGLIQTNVVIFGWITTPGVVTTPIYILIFGGIMVGFGLLFAAISQS